MRDFVFAAMNFGGMLLCLIGVFVFANGFSGRPLALGAFKLPGDFEIGFFLIVLGLILFGLSFIGGKFFRKKS